MAMTKTQTAVINWLANGQTGSSSKAMAFYLGFGLISEENGRSHPWDPSDFNRCVMLLRQAPGLRKKLPELAKLSKTWKKLVKHWNELETSLQREVGENWANNRSASAPLTYAMMKAIIEGKPVNKLK